MALKMIESFVAAPAPGFRCIAAGKKSDASFIAAVRHTLNPPASAAALAELRQRLGTHAAQAAAFYQHHDGFLLYEDTRSDAAGFELLPIASWQGATSDMLDWFGHLADEPDSDPDHIATGIAIATVPHSGNYFVMPIQGPSAGKIFYADHDGWYESAFADDFDGFLTRVTRDPAKLLRDDVGCYTRYSDGQTNTQWIPGEYFPDVTKLTRD